MKIITALTGQTLFDIALQEMGSIDGVFDILQENPFLRIDMSIPAGTKVLVPDTVINYTVVDYYTRNNIKPVSGIGEEVTITDEGMIYYKQEVLYDLSGGNKEFEGVRLWNLDNGNLTIQVNYEDLTESTNEVQVQQSLDGINWTDIDGAIAGLDKEASSYTFNLTGLLTNYARIILTAAESETGTISEIIWRQ